MSEETTVELVAPAVSLKWLLLRQEPPANSPLGPTGGGITLHHFWADTKAPLPFVGAPALQAYVTQASTPSSADEPLAFYRSDVNKYNFIIDQQECVCMIDFE
jgi:hypothetical protein